MTTTQGEIDDSKARESSLPEVTELGPFHYIVKSEDKITEVFLSSDGLFGDGNVVEGIDVNFETDKERLIRERFSSPGEQGTSGKVPAKGSILKAPMPGMVRAVSVSVGEMVQKTTQVLVLEAMKMENSINAGFSGVVSKIFVEIGTSVEKNTVLIEFAE